VRRDSRGSLPLIDAVLFLAVISVVAALVLAQAPAPHRDPTEEVNRYARSVLDALLESTLGPVVLPGTPHETVLDAGPVYRVLAQALRVGLGNPVDYGPLGVMVGGLLGDLVRSDWAWRFRIQAQREGISTGFVVGVGRGSFDGFAGDYDSAVTILDLGDTGATRVRFSLDLFPAP